MIRNSPNVALPLRMRRRAVAVGVFGSLSAWPMRPSAAATDPASLDVSRYIYVPSATAPEVTVIDGETNRVVGNMHIGAVVREAVISKAAATIVSVGDRSRIVSLLDAFLGTTRTVNIPSVAERLAVSANGKLVAASDLETGSIAIIDVGDGRIMTVIDGPARLRDVMFGENDTVLYLAAEGLGKVGVVDVATGHLLRMMGAGGSDTGGIAALARMSDGRIGSCPDGGRRSDQRS